MPVPTMSLRSLRLMVILVGSRNHKPLPALILIAVLPSLDALRPTTSELEIIGFQRTQVVGSMRSFYGLFFIYLLYNNQQWR